MQLSVNGVGQPSHSVSGAADRGLASNEQVRCDFPLKETGSGTVGRLDVEQTMGGLKI